MKVSLVGVALAASIFSDVASAQGNTGGLRNSNEVKRKKLQGPGNIKGLKKKLLLEDLLDLERKSPKSKEHPSKDPPPKMMEDLLTVLQPETKFPKKATKAPTKDPNKIPKITKVPKSDSSEAPESSPYSSIWQHEDVGCAANATSLSIGGRISGSTELSDVDDFTGCGGGTSNVYGSRGNWYTVVGTGATLSASTCAFANFDTQITVYYVDAGTCTCVDGDDDDYACDADDSRSTVVWDTEAGETYYVLVYGWDEVGDFTLTLDDVSSRANLRNKLLNGMFAPTEEDTSTYGKYKLLDDIKNLKPHPPKKTPKETAEPAGYGQPATTPVSSPAATCNGVTVVSLDIGDVRQDSTSNSPESFLEGCGGGTADVEDAKGNWYTVVGNGATLTASTCASASFDTQISIFEGSCSNLSCVEGDDDDYSCAADSSRSSAVWDSEAGVTYYVLVYGWYDEEGDFTLSITD